jgi:putative membrane protein
MKPTFRARAVVCALSTLAVTLAMEGAALAASSPPGVVDDQSFLAQALATNRLELALGRLAIERAVTTTVQGMGRGMMQMHAVLGELLAQLAVESGARSGEFSAVDAAALWRLAATPTEGFDEAFVQTFDDIRRRELALYEWAQERATWAALRVIASARVAMLRRSVAERPQEDRGW